MPLSKNHHIIPEFYLKNFTNSKGSIHVFSKSLIKSWKSKPNKISIIGKYYRPESSEANPESLELFLSKIESKAAPAIDYLINNHEMPDGEDYFNLMVFLTLLHIRIPDFRKTASNFFEKIMKKCLAITTSDEDIFNNISSRMAKESEESISIPYESMREFIERDEYSVLFNNDFHLGAMMETFPKLIPFFDKRKWTVLVSEVKNSFVCSDNPVALRWSDQNLIEGLHPGLGHKKTDVSIPISSGIAIIGNFETYYETEVLEYLIASINTNTIREADQVYSNSDDFLWIKKDNSIGNKKELEKTLTTRE